jgi:hypothetical protein
MSDELRDGLRAAAEVDGGTRPDVAGLWRIGRRRRRARRVAGATAAVVVVLAVGAAALAVGADDDGQQVITTAAAAVTTIDPGSCWPAPMGQGDAPPATIDEFVHGVTSRESNGVPAVVARGTVVQAYWFGPTDLLPGPPAWNRMIALEVTDPVTGAETGEVLEVLVADPVPARKATRKSDEALERDRQETQRRIDDVQREVDQIARPLAALDEQILELPPGDPRLQGLEDARATVEAETEAQREEAQDRLSSLMQLLHRFQLAERAGMSAARPSVAHGPPCRSLQKGDDIIVALAATEREPLYRLASPSSFLVIDPDGTFSEDVDAARSSVPAWDSDTELLRLARESTPDELLARLRAATGD